MEEIVEDLMVGHWKVLLDTMHPIGSLKDMHKASTKVIGRI